MVVERRQPAPVADRTAEIAEIEAGIARTDRVLAECYVWHYPRWVEPALRDERAELRRRLAELKEPTQ